MEKKIDKQYLFDIDENIKNSCNLFLHEEIINITIECFQDLGKITENLTTSLKK